MKKTLLIMFSVLLCLALTMGIFAGGQKEEAKPVPAEKKAEPVSIAVFVPGVAAGSPLYEQMVSGTQKVAAELPNLTVKVIEGGFNQAEWGEKVTSLAATGEYTYILTSNPAMPFVCLEVAKNFPKQKFINVDAYFSGNPQFYTLLYNQVEQGYFSGYLAGLVTKSKMKGANPDLKVGMIVAQEYPALTKMMKPGYEQGFKAVDPNITLDYRVIGNWYDANKAAELAKSMMDAGVDIILSICGGAAQGVIKAAEERGKYVLYFDSNEYKLAPGTIIGCSILRQEKAVYEIVKKAVEGTLPFGKAEIVNTKDGYVDFADDDPLYIDNVPEDVRVKMAEVVKQIRTGQLKLEVPQL
ncbi:MAG: BMP family ABC transporter substrate-binding protein [Spirochaetota bacterium]